MISKRWSYRILGSLAALPCLWTVCLAGPTQAVAQEQAAPADGADDKLVIKSVPNLPDTRIGSPYRFRLFAMGGSQPFHWRVEKGSLPPGVKLNDDGLLTGAAQHGGEFHFTVVVRDSGGPQQIARMDCVIRVLTAFTLAWKDAAHVNGNRIEGTVQVSNNTPDDIDLTFYVLAIAGNRRATAIGYQHFPLLKGTVNMELPFGDTLPPGGYVVHVDVVGEVAPKNVIYRESLETPHALQVTVGP